MKLFELYAELGLDATKFNTGISDAKASMLGLSGDISSKAFTIDGEISALDKLIADLDEEIADLELDLEIGDLESEINTLTKDIKDLDFKESFMKGFYEGLTDASTDILKELISAGFEFLGESVKTASESGSEAAQAYNKAFAKIELGADNLSHALGNKLMPVLTSVYEAFSSILGVSDADLAMSMLEQLDSYKFESLKQAEASLKNIFSFGEAYNQPEEKMNLSSILAGIESQNEYWKDYQKTIIELQNRGLSSSFLADLATGTQADYNLLSFFSDLSNADISSLADAVAQLEESRKGAAEIFSELQLLDDQEYLSNLEEYKNFVDNLDRGGGRRFGDPEFYNERESEGDDSATLEAAIYQLIGTLQGMTDGMSTMKSDVLAAVQEGVGNISVTGHVSTGNVMLNTGALVGGLFPSLNLALGMARNGRG